ncbi:hypothetical protein BDP81DRAFT_439217 [Colletotrichum phormii]|uniref:Uncharacterized protein n=1 Tax=Colletotrichum phormii TaxID=359342 RepID=A0AAI9ZFK7_9PEZI|nr:uncharacterized protein BDP81DRAFT_439217 [Colletotrichum phormii]KAK1623629.1 hypothetical protein BDP81DRAFT_439217 [Colletotrichum phormii]
MDGINRSSPGYRLFRTRAYPAPGPQPRSFNLAVKTLEAQRFVPSAFAQRHFKVPGIHIQPSLRSISHAVVCREVALARSSTLNKGGPDRPLRSALLLLTGKRFRFDRRPGIASSPLVPGSTPKWRIGSLRDDHQRGNTKQEYQPRQYSNSSNTNTKH